MTLRRQLIEVLSREPRSVSRLARDLGLPGADVKNALEHVIRSARAAGHRIIVLPAQCRSCGFMFGERKLAKPGRCPTCRKSRIVEPRIGVETTS